MSGGHWVSFRGLQHSAETPKGLGVRGSDPWVSFPTWNGREAPLSTHSLLHTPHHSPVTASLPPIQIPTWAHCGIERGGVCCNHIAQPWDFWTCQGCTEGRGKPSGPQCVVYVSPGPPDFEEELADCTAQLGETVKLACRVTGTPRPIISWYKGRSPWPRGAGSATGKSHPRGIRLGGNQGPRVGPGQGLGVRDRSPAPVAGSQIKDSLSRAHEVG